MKPAELLAELARLSVVIDADSNSRPVLDGMRQATRPIVPYYAAGSKGWIDGKSCATAWRWYGGALAAAGFRSWSCPTWAVARWSTRCCPRAAPSEIA
jgi:hypothetical protein